mmetsp:Transcript_30642/g.30966  ORF Transcript_30642/g.30966 Transcript_30642/m.30966 type:complete len:82 (-) Transcript_30642:495-740(-)
MRYCTFKLSHKNFTMMIKHPYHRSVLTVFAIFSSYIAPKEANVSLVVQHFLMNHAMHHQLSVVVKKIESISFCPDKLYVYI